MLSQVSGFRLGPSLLLPQSFGLVTKKPEDSGYETGLKYGHQGDMPQCAYYLGVCIKLALRKYVVIACLHGGGGPQPV